MYELYDAHAFELSAMICETLGHLPALSAEVTEVIVDVEVSSVVVVVLCL